MSKINTLLGLLFITIIFSCNSSDNHTKNKDENNNNLPESIIGETMPLWEEGYLDIHAINTGRGESTLLIFPDGTTMLIDAAGSLINPDHEIPPPPKKPNINTSPGTTITNYANHFIANASNKINYLMVSHFHGDHMGSYSDDLPENTSSSFKMTGVTEVGANIECEKILDRGYPEYNFPESMTSNPMISNYIYFINWSKNEYGSIVEQFQVGRNDQIVLKQNPLKYPSFQIQNLIANGVIWTGTGNQTTNTLPATNELILGNAPENIFSIGLELSYGKFNYFTGGDLQYNGRSTYSWKDIEAPLAQIVKPVDVMKSNHHGTSNCNSDLLLNKLKPKVVLSHTWRDVHPNPETIARMYQSNNDCQIFTTNMSNANKTRIGPNLNKIKSLEGHIIVRVNPDGDEYNIYVLDDSNQKYNVIRTFGPYQAF